MATFKAMEMEPVYVIGYNEIIWNWS